VGAAETYENATVAVSRCEKVRHLGDEEVIVIEKPVRSDQGPVFPRAPPAAEIEDSPRRPRRRTWPTADISPNLPTASGVLVEIPSICEIEKLLIKSEIKARTLQLIPKDDSRQPLGGGAAEEKDVVGRKELDLLALRQLTKLWDPGDPCSRDIRQHIAVVWVQRTSVREKRMHRIASISSRRRERRIDTEKLPCVGFEGTLYVATREVAAQSIDSLGSILPYQQRCIYGAAVGHADMMAKSFGAWRSISS
jgi:hypothetical protein